MRGSPLGRKHRHNNDREEANLGTVKMLSQPYQKVAYEQALL